MSKLLLLICAGLLFMSSCVAVKSYEMVNLNDPDMALSSRTDERNVSTFHAYREGAASANGGKTGGGCGCN
ncbi:MAG: DUF4266 domain-containing protein [Bacteroidia bacterium]